MNDNEIFIITDINITLVNPKICNETINNPIISLRTNCKNFNGYLIFSISLLNLLMISLLFDNSKKENNGIDNIFDKIFFVIFLFK